MRVYPNVKVRRSVRNQSSRNGIRPNLIVVHTTESHNVRGAADLAAIGAWFDNPSAQASAHVCTDADGNSARFVSDDAKAWACMDYNSRSLNIEQIGFASTSAKGWAAQRAELHETARWIAYWSKKYGIPIRRVKPNTSGVIGHRGLGLSGGGHHDPGDNYPWGYVLGKARLYKAAMTKKGVAAL